jgi:hypothetical protein
MVVNRPLDRRASGLKLGGLALDFEGALRLGGPCLWRKFQDSLPEPLDTITCITRRCSWVSRACGTGCASVCSPPSTSESPSATPWAA